MVMRARLALPASTLALLLGLATSAAAEENPYYRISTIPIPKGLVLEAGALELLPGRKLAASTRHGDIYTIDGAFETHPAHPVFTRFAGGLHEVLGLALRDGWLYAVQRGEVSRLRDTNGDGRADEIETVTDAWGIDGNYHEYAFGSKFDKDGYLCVALCLTGSFTSDSLYRGWCARVSPDGKFLPACAGVRSPGGIGFNAAGDVFFTDNQGPWNGTCSLKHVEPGDFAGHPAGLRWWGEAEERLLGPRPALPRDGSRLHDEARRIPKLRPPAVYFPYGKMGQSASGFVADMTGGKFGPFRTQVFVGDNNHSTVMRVFLEKVGGLYQGACFPFKGGFDSGNLALLLAPDGSLFVYGTDRGWGSRGGKPFALQRLDWTGKIPFEVHEMRARPDGFELTFTGPVDSAAASVPTSYEMEAYTYIYQETYGSPEVDRRRPVIKSALVAEDGRSVRLVIEGLVVGHVHELHLPGVRSAEGLPLLHPVAFYTLNRVPHP